MCIDSAKQGVAPGFPVHPPETDPSRIDVLSVSCNKSCILHFPLTTCSSHVGLEASYRGCRQARSRARKSNQREGLVGTSLAFQWLRLCASTAGGAGSIPGQGSKILHASWCSPKERERRVWECINTWADWVWQDLYRVQETLRIWSIAKSEAICSVFLHKRSTLEGSKLGLMLWIKPLLTGGFEQVSRPLSSISLCTQWELFYLASG